MISNDDREVPSPPPSERLPFEPAMHNDSFDADGVEPPTPVDPLAEYRRRRVYHRLYSEHTYYPPHQLRTPPVRIVNGQITYLLSINPAHLPGGEPRLVLPPAHLLRSALELVMSRKAYERIIRPYFADEFHEYCEAIRADQGFRAAVIVVRMHVTIWYNVAAAIVLTLIKPIKEVIR